MAYYSATLATLRTAVLQTVEAESDSEPTQAHADRLINEAIQSLHSRVAASPGGFSIFGKSATLSGTGTTVALPSDFFKMVRLYDATGHLSEMDPEWLPAATADAGSHSYTLDYVPTLTRLSDDEDTFACVPPWDTAVIYDAAARLLEKWDMDPQACWRRSAEAMASVLQGAQQADRSGRRQGVRRVRFPAPAGIRSALPQQTYYRLEGQNIRFYKV